MKIKSEFAFGFFLNILNSFFPLLTMPLVLRALGPSGYGQYAHASIISISLISIAIGSLVNYSVRYFIEEKNKGWIFERNAFRELFALQIFTSILAISVHYLFLLLTNSDEYLYLLFLILTLFGMFNFEWYFFSLRKYKFLFIRNLIVKLSTLVAIYVFVNNSDDIDVYIYIMLASMLATFFAGSLQCFVRYGIFPKIEIFKHIKLCKYFFANSFVGFGYRYLDQIIIGFLLDKEAVAYLNIYKLVLNVASSVPSTISRYMAPGAIKANIDNKLWKYIESNFSKYLFCVMFCCVMLVLVGKPILATITGSEFSITYNSFALISIAFLSTALSVFVDNQISVPLKLEKVTTLSNVIVCVVSISFVVFGSSYFGYTSALFGIAIGETIGLTLMLFLHLKVFETKKLILN